MKTANQKNRMKSASKTATFVPETHFPMRFELDMDAIDYIGGNLKEVVNTDERVVRIKQSHHYDVIKAFLRYQFGMVSSENRKNNLPSFYDDKGREFKFDHLEEVYYTYPLSKSGKKCLWIVNCESTLFIYENGDVQFMFDNLMLLAPQARAWQKRNRKKA